MSFQALQDPVDVARAHAATELAYRELQARYRGLDIGAREVLSDIVSNYVPIAASDHELVRRSVKRFLEGASRARRTDTKAP